MKVTRRFTCAEQDPYDGIEFVERSSEIRNPNGSVVFSMDGVKVPESWSQVAVDVLVAVDEEARTVVAIDARTCEELLVAPLPDVAP